MNLAKREAIFQRLQAANPNPTTELRYKSNFELLIAVILSAQATDISVNKATSGLFKVASSADAILALGEHALKHHILHIGLFNSKAKHIMQTCRMLVEKYNGEVPADRAALEALPGVGRKTANVILNTAFGHNTLAVDTHIFRLGNRIPLAKGKTVLEVEKKLMRLIPKNYLRHAHHWLILHGRYVCTAKNPKCAGCLIADLCEYPNKHKL